MIDEEHTIGLADDCLIRQNPILHTMISAHVYEVRPRKDHRGVDLISDALPFGRLWYVEPNAISNAVGYGFRGNHFDLNAADSAAFCRID